MKTIASLSRRRITVCSIVQFFFFSDQVFKFQVSIFQEFRLARCGRIWRMVVVLGAQYVRSRWQWVVWPPSSSGSGGRWAASGYTYFQAVRSFGYSSPWRQAYLGYSGRVRRRRGSSLIQYGWWNSQRGSLYTGDRNQPPQQSFLGGTCRGMLRRRGRQV